MTIFHGGTGELALTSWPLYHLSHSTSCLVVIRALHVPIISLANIVRRPCYPIPPYVMSFHPSLLASPPDFRLTRYSRAEHVNRSSV